MALIALGDALRMFSDRHEEAATVLEQSIALLRLLGDADNMINARTNLALTLLRWNPVLYGACGVWHLSLALIAVRQLGNAHTEAVVLMNLASLLLELCPACHGTSGLECARRATDLIDKEHDPELLHARATLSLGSALRAVGELADGNAHLEEARQAFAARGMRDQVEAASARLLPGEDTGTDHIPGCFGRSRKGAMSWVDEMPRAALRGEHEILSSKRFINFRFVVHEPSPRASRGT